MDLTTPKTLFRYDQWANEQVFVAVARALKPERLHEISEYQTVAGGVWRRPLWRQLLHAVNHSTYHRGQAAMIWSHAAVAFATAYAVLISLNYFVQLTWVAPRLARGQTQGIESFLFVPVDSFLYSVDILGDSFMSLATLFAARVFTGRGLERVVRLLLTANGLLLPFIALQMYVHWLIWIAALWAVTFPGSTWSLAILFRRAGTRVRAPGDAADERMKRTNPGQQGA